MHIKVIGFLLSSLLLCLSGCSSTGTATKSFVRENVSLAYINRVIVPPFQGDPGHVREFAMTQVLSTGLFDVVDKSRVDLQMTYEGLSPGTPLDLATMKRLGKLLKAEAFLFGTVNETTGARGNASFPEITMTLRLIDTETGTLLWQASGRGSGYSLTDRLLGMAPQDSFEVTMDLLYDLFATIR